jgi:hypothetical protein
VTLDFGGLGIGANPLCGVTPGCVLSNPNPPVSTLDSVSGGGVTIGVNAYGNSTRTPIFLTQRPDGPGLNPADESGIGVSTSDGILAPPSDSDLEINTGEYVLLDNNIAEGLGFTPTDIWVGSLQAGESGTIWGYTGADGSISLANLHPLVGGTLTGTALNTLQDFNLSQGGANPIYGAYVITGGGITGGDVLVKSEVFASPGVPEPSTWAMMLAGFGLLGFAAMRKGKREARLAV